MLRSIGINTAVFTLVRGVVLNPLPFPDADELVMIWKGTTLTAGRRDGVAPRDYFDLQKRISSASDVAAFFSSRLDVSDLAEPYRVRGATISDNFFTMLGVQPVLGRDLSPEDGEAGAPPVTILSHGLWQERFGGDPGVVGSDIRVSGTRYTVVGVMGADFTFPEMNWGVTDFDLWTSFSQMSSRVRQQWGASYIGVVARLLPDVPVATLQAELETISRQFAAEQPQVYAGKTLTVVPLHQQVTGSVRPLLWMLWGAVVCVLLIACANLANMLLTRASARQKELAVRASLGAKRRNWIH